MEAAMNSLPWFRLYTEMIDDEKLGLLAFEDRWHFVALLCLKGKGVLDSEPDTELLQRKVALKMGLTCAELEKVISRLARMGLVDKETFQPFAWRARQMQSDSSTERVKAYRERMKKDGTAVKRFGNVAVTAQDTDTDTDTDKEGDTEKTVGFASFWSVYPKKTAKPSAERAFKAAKLKAGELDSILRDIETRKQSDDWKKESGRYVPNPSTYLNNKRWQDGETAHTSTFAKVMVGAV